MVYGFGSELENIIQLGKTGGAGGSSYSARVEQAYRNYKAGQIGDAYATAVENSGQDNLVASVMDIAFGNPRLVPLVEKYVGVKLSKEDTLKDVLVKLEALNEKNCEHASMVSYLASQGIEKQTEPSELVTDPEVMAGAIIQVYGGLEAYKGKIRSEVVALSGFFAQLRKLEQAKELGLAARVVDIVKLVEEEVTGKGQGVVGNVAERGVQGIRNCVRDIVEFGEGFMTAYAATRAEEVGRYETAAKAIEQRKQRESDEIRRGQLRANIQCSEEELKAVEERLQEEG